MAVDASPAVVAVRAMLVPLIALGVILARAIRELRERLARAAAGRRRRRVGARRRRWRKLDVRVDFRPAPALLRDRVASV